LWFFENEVQHRVGGVGLDLVGEVEPGLEADIDAAGGDPEIPRAATTTRPTARRASPSTRRFAAGAAPARTSTQGVAHQGAGAVEDSPLDPDALALGLGPGEHVGEIRGWGRTGSDFDTGLWFFETVKPGPVEGRKGHRPMARGIGLPDLQEGVAHQGAGAVEDSPLDPDALALGLGSDFDTGLWFFETVKPGPVEGRKGHRPMAPHVNLWIGWL
jgi:hypothetical protein